jgi:hypothetical protein
MNVKKIMRLMLWHGFNTVVEKTFQNEKHIVYHRSNTGNWLAPRLFRMARRQYHLHLIGPGHYIVFVRYHQERKRLDAHYLLTGKHPEQVDNRTFPGLFLRSHFCNYCLCLTAQGSSGCPFFMPLWQNPAAMHQTESAPKPI